MSLQDELRKIYRDPSAVTARELVIACMEEERPALVLTFFHDDIAAIKANEYYTVSVVRHTIDRPLEVVLDEAHVAGVTV